MPQIASTSLLSPKYAPEMHRDCNTEHGQCHCGATRLHYGAHLRWPQVSTQCTVNAHVAHSRGAERRGVPARADAPTVRAGRGDRSRLIVHGERARCAFAGGGTARRARAAEVDAHRARHCRSSVRLAKANERGLGLCGCSKGLYWSIPACHDCPEKPPQVSRRNAMPGVWQETNLTEIF